MKKEKITFIGFLTASIIYFISSILNFIDKNISTAVMFLCLAITHLDKDLNQDKKDKQEKY